MPAASDSTDVAVIGAGAAGLLAATFAARAGARLLLLEKTRQGGKKIVVSGGGRCNVLPSVVDERVFVTDSSRRLMGRILASWPLAEQRSFFEDDLGIPLALEPETGKLFPVSNRATDVRDGLVEAVREAGAETRFDADVAAVESDGDGWRVDVRGGESVRARAVVVATGGLSVPKTGSDGFGLRLAARQGHRVEPTYPALAPLLADPAPHADLAGVSLPDAHVRVPLGKGAFETSGGFLFTHRGYSGPAVLNVSHLTALGRARGEAPEVRVAWTPDDAETWEAALTAPGPGLVITALRQTLPTRLADRLLADADVPADRNRADLRRDERLRLLDALTSYPLPWTGDEGYKKAEVTGGGVALGEVDPRTLESRHHAGLHFAGEVLDAFGPIGGYNFFWAWATGRLAGLAAAAGAAERSAEAG
ncbi:NAD(P)/FAD-dependent oxidoreductase [Rubrivirga marina]|uniref:Oxidoreductase n=1 Tax=Rubrivirga marina TaxID=1196024 RepID=A0A271J107_9BACT|nr:aminoacetone oxidase family FAD-binding enzyme [Rubrivirga marina]PAP76419.1 oxidoreductase [Rubrivirga marina]